MYGLNREEIDSDGTEILPRGFYNESVINSTFVDNKQISVTYTFSDGQTVTINNRGLKVFSRRATLRIEMILQQFRIAREVRTNY